MIYDIDEKQRLRPLTNPPNAQSLSATDKLKMTAGCILFAPVALLITVSALCTTIALGFRNRQDDPREDNAELTDESDEETFQVAVDYDPDRCIVHIRMNQAALRDFTRTIRDALLGGRAPAVVYASGKSGIRDPGFHVHASDVWPFADGEITTIFGIDDGLLRVVDGDNLYAPPELWEQVFDAWLRTANQREPRLIVLDEHQQHTCDPESTGRFMIEYLPDFVAREDKQPVDS